MSGRPKTLIVILSLIAAGLSTSLFAELRDATAAMECCAKAQYECAGMAAPDDCCRGMHHTSAPVNPSILQASNAAHDAAIVAPAHVTSLVGSLADLAGPARVAARPHDPPHLHTFSLLI